VLVQEQKQDKKEYKVDNVYNLVHRRRPFVVQDEERALDIVLYKHHNQNIDLPELQNGGFEVCP